MRTELELDLERRAEDLRSYLEGFVAEHSQEPLAWITVPALTVLMVSVRRRSLEPIGGRLGGKDLRSRRRLSDRQARTGAGNPAVFYSASDVLFEADGANQYRTLEGIIERFGQSTAPPGNLSATRRRIRQLSRRAFHLGERFIHGALARGIWLSTETENVYAHFAVASRVLAYAEALLDEVDPAAVVIAAPANIPPRALVHAAREAGVPSVYFPHAPVLADPAYNDLTTDFAGLRGPAEMDYYSALTDLDDRAEVVGNPSIASDAAPTYDPSLAPVLAPPIRPDEMAAVFEMVHSAVGDAVLVCPHPRSDLEFLASMIPSGWTVWAGRSYEALLQGPPALLHYSSGLALEAQVLGIPTIELRWPAEMQTAYPAIENPHVYAASSAEDLRHAMASARRDVESSARRTRLREAARRWCAHVGEDAAMRGAALVERAKREPPRGPIWDAWEAGRIVAGPKGSA